MYYNDFGWNPINAFSSVNTGDVNYWDNGAVGNWWSNYNGTGSYNISGTANQQDMHPSRSLVVGTANDMQYELGSTGNTLFLGAQALNPGYYEVVANATLIDTKNWNGGDIYADIDGLGVGVYTVTARVYHISGHLATRSATVIVVDTTAPEWVVTPVDQTLAIGEALSYQVGAIDFSEISEWIVNDTQHFSIVNGLISNATVLEIGNYSLNVTVVDIYGNARSAIITIHVVPISNPGGDLTGLLLLIGGGAAAIVVVVVLVVFMKKRS
jgi:hypothetical protein